MKYLLALTVFVLPLYSVRFDLWGLPANVLLVWLAVLIAGLGVAMLWQKRVGEFCKSIVELPKILLLGMAALGLAGVTSWQWFGGSTEALGQLVVLVVEPLLLFLLFRFFTKDKQEELLRWFVWAVLIFLFASGLAALVQYFTLYGLDPAYWGNSMEPKRALGIFSHPNFYGLFAAPLLAFTWPSVFGQAGKYKYLKWVIWWVALAGVFLTLSRGAWLGLVVAGFVWFLFFSKGRVRFVSLAVGLVVVGVILAVPNWRFRVLLPFYGEQSASQRSLLWDKATTKLSTSPVFGWGLTGFAGPVPDTCNLSLPDCDGLTVAERELQLQKHSHNFWLTAWGELGVLGFLAFGLIFLAVIIRAAKYSRSSAVHAGILLALVAMLAHGLVDTPYFKNDLAAVFWLLLVWL